MNAQDHAKDRYQGRLDNESMMKLKVGIKNSSLLKSLLNVNHEHKHVIEDKKLRNWETLTPFQEKHFISCGIHFSKKVWRPKRKKSRSCASVTGG